MHLTASPTADVAASTTRGAGTTGLARLEILRNLVRLGRPHSRRNGFETLFQGGPVLLPVHLTPSLIL